MSNPLDLMDDLAAYWTNGFVPLSISAQAPRTYVNPLGNLVASGLYRSYITQDIANDFPQWMEIRWNQKSVGQQLIASEAILMEWLQEDLEYNITSKFIGTAPLGEIDVLYKINIPSNMSLLEADSPGLTCVAAPSGYLLGSTSQIQIQESNSLEDFYYNELPTRIELSFPAMYSESINGVDWDVLPSGILDKQSKLYDRWKNKHNITWCYTNGNIMKQDSITMEAYETYAWNDDGLVNDMVYINGMLWCLAQDASGSYLSLLSTKTQIPPLPELDYLARFDLFLSLPYGEILDKIMVDQYGQIWAKNYECTLIYGLQPRYDYFIVDNQTRAVYFREDYSYSGVLMSNA